MEIGSDPEGITGEGNKFIDSNAQSNKGCLQL